MSVEVGAVCTAFHYASVNMLSILMSCDIHCLGGTDSDENKIRSASADKI